MKKWILTLALAGLAGADPLADALQALSTMQEGKFRIESQLPEGRTQTATLAFRRPDQLHYVSETKIPNQPWVQNHCWLKEKRMWAWTSESNSYTSQDLPDGLRQAPMHFSLGPANFLTMLLSGQRDMFELDPAKKDDSSIWTADGDQLNLDPATHLLKEIVAWRQGKEMARARITIDKNPVQAEDLLWTLPDDAKVMKD